MFADTDFLLALIKDSDWLKEKAERIFKEQKDKITTSASVMIELALLCKRLKMEASVVFANVLELVDIDEETYNVSMRAAVYMEKYNSNVFDAFHAAYCKNDTIISSDSVYEKIGLKRLKLEE